MRTRIVNIKYDEYDVFIGRPSKWGSPFEIGIDGSRKQVIEKYKKWILSQKKLLRDLHELKGKRLGCFCHPKPCHGDVLVELIEGKEVISDYDPNFEWRARDII